MKTWQGKTYWLIGASEGLGAALAHQLSRVGTRVILSARNEETLNALADDLPGPARVLPLDVTDREAVHAAAEEAGEVDGVVYLAGAYWPFGAEGWDAEQAETMADVNFGGAMRVVGAVLPRMQERGRGHLVLTGSLTAYGGLPGAAPYTATKAGIMALAESLRCDLQDSGIEVQLLNPGFIRTRLTEKNDFRMPGIMEPEKAARICFEHMNSHAFSRAFPTWFSLIFRGARYLPNWLYFRLFS
ncbi:Short-chain dehydrogenase/reductase family protein [Pseudooceanicola batsensis HTCC2597]|uniref:Short-chain dehydrogenase/reductase family protein n=1 Tax=Pseudooceanicola batsensis (strain ATCC BAA-863 / DSM 15984 / KCTC 12145 / HTCC2597) TaxID=252305 RepID=A3TYG7_PSEBH|nr:SDR family NAD(P)-dependent oxidoreductase [Pseudooceanicola batsensis]EAQ03201.1 Short-chain dehydrogenase/reductase family protein [Pseudooceanicola batsensis HTCC2597]